MGNLLTVDLIPQEAWGINLRSELPKAQWDALRRSVYRKAKYRCEICGGTGTEWPVECHEIWEFDEKEQTQKLVRLIALCPDCHAVKHFGRTQVVGNMDKAVEHILKVNGWTKKQLMDHLDEAFRLWRQRMAIQWQLDLSYLKNYNLKKETAE